MTEKVYPPVHPGEILLEEFLEPLGISQYRLAKDINVPIPRINAIILQRRGISADTALRLARYFETTEQFWLNLQARYELECAKDELGTSLDDDIPMVVSERLATYKAKSEE
ncbi:HigA family addiction module antitoxin [Gemmatimonadota bacterium]